MKYIIFLLVLIPSIMRGQDTRSTAADSLRDTYTAPTLSEMQPDQGDPEDSVSVGENTPLDPAVRPHLSAGSWIWSKDSVSLIEYHHLGEIAAHHPSAQLFHLGNYGQPAWFGLGGSMPYQSTVTVNGLQSDQLSSSLPDLYRFSTEDAERFTIYPQYQAFWFGMPGDVAVVDVEKRVWNAPRPVTRLRHTESANEYLYTDGMFTLNPSERSNIYIGLTRTGIGSASSNNAARYANNRHESWNARATYRNHISDFMTLSGRVQYDDHLTLLNGGISGTFTADAASPYTFESEERGSFASTAFDPKSAELVNPTMYTEGQHYHAEAAALLRWNDDSTQVTQLRLTVDSDVRRFRDNLAALYPADSLAEPQLNLTDHWSLTQAVLDHSTHLGWAELELQGAFGGYRVVMGGEALDDADIVAHARGKLSLFLGPVAIAGFGRLDQRFGSSTISFGAGGEIPAGPLTFWGGASYSARPRSPLERFYTGARVVSSGSRSPDLDKVAIAEGGVRLSTDWLSADLRGFARNETRYAMMHARAYSETVLGRYSLHFLPIPPGGEQRTFVGASMDARLRFWRFHIDQRAAMLKVDVSPDDLPAPEISYSAELYYRGGLIEGTLDLRVGARFSYASQFLPLTYHPEAGVFANDVTFHPALPSYTDMKRIDLFLFATIKQSATIHIVLYNLLDERHITTTFYPMFDRAFRLGVDWVFFD